MNADGKARQEQQNLKDQKQQTGFSLVLLFEIIGLVPLDLIGVHRRSSASN